LVGYTYENGSNFKGKKRHNCIYFSQYNTKKLFLFVSKREQMIRKAREKREASIIWQSPVQNLGLYQVVNTNLPKLLFWFGLLGFSFEKLKRLSQQENY